MKQALIAVTLLLLSAAGVKAQTVVDFTGHGGGWLCNNSFAVTEINGQAATGTVIVCTAWAYGTFWVQDQDGIRHPITITHAATQAEPWVSFTYEGGSGTLFGKWQVAYKSGLQFFYTGGSLVEN